MRISMGCALVGSLVVLCVSGLNVPAQERQNMTLQPCSTFTKYPDNPEVILADFVIELVKTTSRENDLLLPEAEELRTPEGQKEVRKYLKERVEIGSEEEKAYRFCSLLRDFEAALGEEDQAKLNQLLNQQMIASPPKTTRKCMPFLCIFRICKC